MKRAALLVASLFLAACGGGSGTGVGGTQSPPPSSQPSPTAVQINLGDDPADRLVAVEVTVNSMSLIGASGGSVAVASTARPMEMMRLMGTVAPLAMASVPQGTYTGATMTFGTSTVTYVDPTTGQTVQRTMPGPMTTSVMFSTPLVVGTSPMVINLDMNMASSVGIDTAGNASMAPAMTARYNPVVTGSSDPEDGGMHGVTGTVSNVTGNSMMFTLMQGMPGISLMVNAATQFGGMDGMGMMGSGNLLSVDATLQPDGSWMATRVQQRMAAGGAMAAGVVTSLTGTPPTQLVLVTNDGAGNGMMATNLAGTTTVNITDSTTFSVETRDVDLANLPFTPKFDRASVTCGQRVETISTGQMMQGGGMQGMMGGGTLRARLRGRRLRVPAAIRRDRSGRRGAHR
jgi:hypothetical protein